MIEPQNAKLDYEGPKTPEELREHRGEFSLTVGVRVQRNKVMRTRPKFEHWAAEFNVEYETELLNESDVREILVVAGAQVGIGDWRPKYGLFPVVGSESGSPPQGCS